MPMTLTRSLLTILIPGLVAIAPWLILAIQYTSATLGFDRNVGLANALVFACAAVVGSLFEAFGTALESAWDEEREALFAVRENWFVYLSQNVNPEPVGYRYLSRTVTALYFELSMMFAAPIFIAGACILASLRFSPIALLMAIGSLTLVVTVGSYFHRQARCTHALLCETRREINARTNAAST